MQRHKLSFFLVGSVWLCLCVSFALALFSNPLRADEHGDRPDFDRLNYGHSNTSIWSPLTAFELDTLHRANAIRRGDADALLALFLVASGDVRDRATFNRYRERIDSWLDDLRPRLDAIGNEKKRGRALYQAMYAEFFPPQDEDDEVATGYDLDQSKLSGIFTDQSFNCISSSLLFMVAAHKVGFNTKGVLLPSHSFVELHLSNGEQVEVETTSRNGYDLIHDEAFYEARSDDWFTERGLEPLSYAQYRQREIIEPYKLGLYNMWSQHTGPQRMRYADRMRLAEIRAAFLPADITVQKTRLSFYNQEFNYLHEQQDFATLERMYRQIQPYLQSLEHLRGRDPELHNLLAWVHSQQALTLVNSGEPAQGIVLVRQLLQNLEPDLSDYDRIQSNLYLVLANFLQERSDDEDFNGARSAVAGFEKHCLDNSACANGLAGLYADWARYFWSKREWQQAIDVYHQYLDLDGDSEYATTFRTNVQKAHINWANQELVDEDWEGASEILRRCTTKLDEAARCDERLQTIKEEVHLGNL